MARGPAEAKVQTDWQGDHSRSEECLTILGLRLAPEEAVRCIFLGFGFPESQGHGERN